jgi:hypothetical protein
MDGDQGALNKIEHGLQDTATGNFSDAGTEFSAAWHDLVVSAENLAGKAATDGEKLLALGAQTFLADLKTPLAQAAATAIGTAIADGVAGKSVKQIGDDVLPTLDTNLVAGAKAAGQDAENTVYNAARVMLLGQQAQTAGNTSSDASAVDQAGSQSSGQ